MKLKTTLSPKQAPKKKSTSEKVAQWVTITFVAATLITILLSLVSYNAPMYQPFSIRLYQKPLATSLVFGAQIAGLSSTFLAAQSG